MANFVLSNPRIDKNLCRFQIYIASWPPNLRTMQYEMLAFTCRQTSVVLSSTLSTWSPSCLFSLVPVYIGGTEIPASTGQYLPDSPGPQALSMHQVFGAHVVGRVRGPCCGTYSGPMLWDVSGAHVVASILGRFCLRDDLGHMHNFQYLPEPASTHQ